MFITQHGIIDSQQGFNEVYQRMNINSLGISDKDRVNLGSSLFDNIRTISIRIELTTDINTTTNNGIYTFIARYRIVNRTGSYFIRFNNGRIQFLFWNGSAFIVVQSDNNSWVNGQIIDVTAQFNSSLGRILFIDGVQQADSHAYFGDSQTSIYNTYIGGLIEEDAQYFFGKVSNLQVWDNELTSSEINSLIGVVPSPTATGLKECYPFLNETGSATTGIKGSVGVISTNNAGGVTHINNVIREII